MYTTFKHVQNSPNWVDNSSDENLVPLNEWEEADLFEAMRCQAGDMKQKAAYDSLGVFFFKSVRLFLLRRRDGYPLLATMVNEEIESLAQDITQVCLERLSKNEHKLLAQFRGQGSFSGWAVQIVLNEARSRLRLVRFQKVQFLKEVHLNIVDRIPDPEITSQQSYIRTTLSQCLEKLPEHYRTIFIRKILHGEQAKRIGEDFGVSAQAIYNIVNRAKKQLRSLIENEGITIEDVVLFENSVCAASPF